MRMRLPRNLLSPGTYAKPRIFLCETNKERICQLETSNTKGSFKFNSYSELSFEVGRFYNDIITGEVLINPYFDKVEALRLIELEDIGYFEIQGPELTGDGIKESKNITTYSLEYTLSQKYLEDFYVNTGEVNSIEVINASSEDNIIPVTLYNPNNKKLSLLHLILEKIYGWKIGHIDPQLQTLSRQFEVDRESVYDFLMNEVCEKFNCYIDFDTINNEINIYAESPTAKFIGDGITNIFKIGTLSSTFSEVKTVSIDGYKTTKWQYGIVDGLGILVLEDIPESGSMIEVVGVDATWETDVFVTYGNLSQEIKVNYDADSIKTVLTVTFGDDNDIREVNLGLPYIVDLSYYCTPEWLGQDLYDDWITYQEKCNSKQPEYIQNSQDMLYYAGQIDYEENRLSLGYAEITVDENTVGTYYVRGGTDPNYYYTEVSLPSEYNVNTTYYSTKTVNLEDGSDGNVAHLYEALKKYFMYAEDWKESLDALSTKFDFIGEDAIVNLSRKLSTVDKISMSRFRAADHIIKDFLAIMWNEIGRTPLKQLYYEPYKKVQITNMEAGWSQKNHAEYGNYYAVVLLLESIETALSERDKIIEKHEAKYNRLISKNTAISNELLIANNFTEGQLVRLNAFLREDELHLDDIVTTSHDSIADTYKNQQDALESGKIELDKISQPQLQFSMSMANIYALPEFEPIIDQFQLGRIIKVALRPDYIKQSRLLQVDMGFDDFSDFSCEFGELTSLRSQSDIHADLLKNAISAGKSVAQNASYWTKGSDQATSTDLKIQQGLLDAVTQIKSMDGTQSVVIDKYGIRLQKENPDTGEIDPHQTWLVNNKILMTDDNWRTSRAGLGQFVIDDMEFYGLVAEAVLSGYIEGSRIRGGTIQIGAQPDGTYAFEVHADGSVTMNGGSSISGYAKEEDVTQLINNIDTTIISDTAPENVKEGQLWLDTSIEPYKLMVLTNGEWQPFSQKNGETIYITQPESYNKGDLWIVNENDLYNSCPVIDDNAAPLLEQVWNGQAEYYTKNGLAIDTIKYTGYQDTNNDDVGDYTTLENGSLNYNIYTSYTELPDPSVMYHPNFFGDGNLNINSRNDSITIYGSSNKIIHHQETIKYYGSDNVASINAAKSSAELFLIYSNGQIYLLPPISENTFFCHLENSGTRHINGTLLQAIESSSVFNYDHWVDISPEDTRQKNNIYQNFTFNKKDGLVIGQTDNEFYVKIDSKEMGFYDNSKGQKEKVVYISNSTANIDNVLVEGSAEFDCNTRFNQQVDFFGFVWKKESNGSLSLAIDS